MFTLEQIDDIHERLGTIERFADFVHALRSIGVVKYDSYLRDGHSEYFAADGRRVISAAVHEVLAINDVSDRAQVIEHLARHERGDTTYLEMSRVMAGAGVERWIVDTQVMTLAYLDKHGRELVTEAIRSEVEPDEFAG